MLRIKPIVFITILSSVGPAKADGSGACRPWIERLSKVDLNTVGERLDRADNVMVVPKPGLNGLNVYTAPSGTHGPRSPRRIEFDAIEAFNAESVAEVWEFEGRVFTYLNVGFKSLETDMANLNGAILDHLAHFPDEDLEIRYGPNRQRLLTALIRTRWTLLEKVLDEYRDDRPELGAADISILRAATMFSSNGDVFGLFEGDLSRTWDRLSAREIDQKALATMQVTYALRRAFLVPTVEGLLIALNRRRHSTQLPFETRVDLAFRDAFLSDFYHSFLPESVCEFGRFKKWGTVPRPIFDRFMLSGFERAISEGQRVAVADVLAGPRRLFARQYGFFLYAPVPVRSSNLKEFLIFQVLNSNLFADVLSDLRKGSRDVRVVRN